MFPEPTSVARRERSYAIPRLVGARRDTRGCEVEPCRCEARQLVGARLNLVGARLTDARLVAVGNARWARPGPYVSLDCRRRVRANLFSKCWISPASARCSRRLRAEIGCTSSSLM